MPLTLKIDGKRAKFATPLRAVKAALSRVTRADSDVDPLALANAACVSSIQAIRTNPPQGRRAAQALKKMVDAFAEGNTERGIKFAVALGIDSLITNSKGAGINHPDTCGAFEAAYNSWVGMEADPAPKIVPAPVPESTPDSSQESVIDPNLLADEYETEDFDEDSDWTEA